MKLLFAAGSSPLSKLIMWALNEPVSHFAIEMDGNLIFQSNLLGVGICGMNNFLSSHKIVKSIDPSASSDQENAVYNSFVNVADGEPYGWLAFIYFCWRALLFKFFKKPIPTSVPALDARWDTGKSGLLCTQAAGLLPPEWIAPLVASQLDIVSPWKLYVAVSQNFPGQN